MSSLVVKEASVVEEYKKTGIDPEDVRKLKEWLHTQPHLPAELITEMDILLTYHCCGRSSEVTKQVLDLHYTLRTLFTSFFKDRVVDDTVERTLSVALILPMPTRTRDGNAFLYSRFLDFDAKKYVFLNTIRASLMVIDLWQYEEGTWPGFEIGIDMVGFGMSHIPKYDMQTLQQFGYYLQEAMLVNLKGFHFLNAPSFMDRLLSILKPFMKKSLQDILHIHQVGSKTMDKFFPMEGLPKECGGSYKTLDECRDEVIAKLKANKEYFAQENKKRVVEEKRPGKPKTVSDFVSGGIGGTFKKLLID